MANVLPLEVQKRVWAMYRARLVLVTSLLLLALAAAAALTLFPSYVALQIAASSVSDDTAVAEADRTDAIALERGQSLVRALLPVIAATSSPMGAVENAVSLKPAGVRITRVIYTSGDEENKITLIGTGSRDAVSAYKDALTNSGAYSAVAVPVGALVGAQGGGFSIVLVGEF